jgi:hypothetical protein
MPNLPFIGRVNFIKSKIGGAVLSYFGMPLTEYFGYGIGKEGDIVDELGKQMEDYYIIGGSTMDDGKQVSCYQFCGNKVYKNSIVALGGSTDNEIFLKGTVNISGPEKPFRITKSTFGKRIITKIENMPAKDRFLEIMDLPDMQYEELGPFYYRTSNYFPITFENNREFVSGVGAFLGNHLLLGYKARDDNAIILSVSGKQTLDCIDKVFLDRENNFPFMLVNASGIRFINMVENGVYILKEKLDNYLGDMPYLLVGFVNENMGLPNTPKYSRVYSFNAFSLKNKLEF